MSFLEVKGLSVQKGEKLLVNNLNFRIESPFLLSLIGDNGSGKTSLLKILLGVETPSGGVVEHGFKTVAYLSQFNDLSFDLMVKDIVVMGLYKQKGFFDNYTKRDYAAVEQVLEEVGLSGSSSKFLSSLSGGELQRVWLCQQLLRKPDLLLLDEPTAHLDIKHKVLFFRLVQELIAKGTSVVCVTHDLYLLKDIKGGYVLLGEKQSKGELSPRFVEDLYEFQ